MAVVNTPLNIPNLDGLGLPVALTTAIRQLGMYMQALLTQSGTDDNSGPITTTGPIRIDPGVSPAPESEIRIQANKLGALALQCITTDNSQVMFDAYRLGSQTIAANATAARIIKNAARLRAQYANGLAVGGVIAAFTTGIDLDLATGNTGFTGIFNTYGNIATSGVGVAAVFGVVDLTGKTAAIGATNLYGPGGNAPAGIYCVGAQVVITTAGNNINVSAQVTYKDPTAGALTDNILTVNALILGNHLSSTTTFKHDGTAAINYQVTLSGAIGAGVYSVRFVLYRMS